MKTRTKRRARGSITSKRGHWYAVLSVGRDQRGRQIRQWSSGFKTKREAEQALAQLLIEDRVAKETRLTVKAVVEEYISRDRTPRGQRSPTTTQGYKYHFSKMETLYSIRVDALDGATIERFYDELRGVGLSGTTIHHVHNLLFAAFKWAKKRSIALITRNPFELYDIERPRRSPSTARAFTRGQARKALKHLLHTKHAYALIFSLATGCRRGETCGLKWDAVDLERRVVTIKESRYQVKGDQGQKRTKSTRVRDVPLNKSALAALQSERQRQEARRKFADDAWVESGHVFTDEMGKPLSPMALTNAFRRIARIADLPTRRMHDLRHTAATFMLSGGATVPATSKILGHSDRTTTLRMYGHVIDDDSDRAARAIDEALEDVNPSGTCGKRKSRKKKLVAANNDTG